METICFIGLAVIAGIETVAVKAFSNSRRLNKLSKNIAGSSGPSSRMEKAIDDIVNKTN